MEADLTDHTSDTIVIAKMIQKVKNGLNDTFIIAAMFIGNRLYPKVQTLWKKPLSLYYSVYTLPPSSWAFIVTRTAPIQIRQKTVPKISFESDLSALKVRVLDV